MSAPSVASVLSAIGAIAPWDKAAGWDPVGLQIGDPAAAAGSVAVCHEVTDAVVTAATEGGAGLLITYHPLLFRPIGRLLAGPTAEGRALTLAAAGVAVATVHTSYDVAAGGTADALADALALSGVAGFGPLWGGDSVKVVTFAPGDAADSIAAAMAAAGGGQIGNYRGCSFRTEGVGAFFPAEGAQPLVGEAGRHNRADEVRIEMNVPGARLNAVAAALVAAHPYDEPAYDVVERRGDAGFVGRVGSPPTATTLGALAAAARETLGGVVRLAGDPDRPVHRVAVVPGAGSDFATAAGAAGADVIVTGDVSHHRARAALAAGVAVIDPGHVPTERPGVRRLYAAVAGVVEPAVDLTGLDASVWREGSAWNS